MYFRAIKRYAQRRKYYSVSCRRRHRRYQRCCRFANYSGHRNQFGDAQKETFTGHRVSLWGEPARAVEQETERLQQPVRTRQRSGAVSRSMPNIIESGVGPGPLFVHTFSKWKKKSSQFSFFSYLLVPSEERSRSADRDVGQLHVRNGDRLSTWKAGNYMRYASLITCLSTGFTWTQT